MLVVSPRNQKQLIHEYTVRAVAREAFREIRATSDRELRIYVVALALEEFNEHGRARDRSDHSGRRKM